MTTQILQLSDFDSLVDESRRAFADEFGREPEFIAAAPGRVNLIGEHTDYNDGFVLPMSIDRHVLVAAASNTSGVARIATNQGAGQAVIELTDDLLRGDPPWSNYVRGVIAGFRNRRIPIQGFDAVIRSTVPVGGGLSSSAALETATATLLEALSGHTLEPVDKALLCQTAEREFAGVPCGIMDQFASVLGKRDHLMLIDCRSLEIRQVPMDPDGEVAILVTNTNVRHELGDSSYSQRVRECREASAFLGVPALRDATPGLLADRQARMTDTTFRRARHVVTEIARTLDAVAAVESRDWPELGRLMCQSHASLRDDYQVSSRELDMLVELAESIGVAGGVYGSRMTGAGFGGCTVSLVAGEHADTVKSKLRDAYTARTGVEPTLFTTRPSAGARIIKAPAS